MLNKILSIIFIVLFSLALSYAVIYSIDAVENRAWTTALISGAIAIFSIARIAHYAKALSNRDDSDE